MTTSFELFALMVVTMTIQCLAQAPGDADFRCTDGHERPPVYPDNVRMLMDSNHYEALLPGNGTTLTTPREGAVWNDRSYEGNDVNDTDQPTYWQQGAGGICRIQTRVCGYRRPGDDQNNWLFTQHIRKDFNNSIYNYPVEVQVELVYRTVGCRERQTGCKEYFFLHDYITNTQTLPSTVGTGFMNTDNYNQLVRVRPAVTSRVYNETFTFTMQSSQTGFYIAIRDTGSCIAVSRLRVYRYNCPPFQTRLVLYPDAPAPASASENINITCVDNAVVSGSAQVTCGSDGRWGPENPVCQCRLGYEDRTTECFPCPADQYRSADDPTCQQCPDNTERDQVAAPECDCVDGYFRDINNTFPEATRGFCSFPANEQANDSCTEPPSKPRSLNFGEILSRELNVSWSEPANNGGRSDLFYEVEHSDPDTLGKYTGTVYLSGGSTSYTVNGLRPYTDYCVRVTAHNCVSDQDPDGTHLRTVEECTRTEEDKPGPVSGVVVYCCEVVVWDRPSEPNGVITSYELLFLGSELPIQRTHDDTTHFTIPALPNGGVGVFVRVRAVTLVGSGAYSDPVYIGGVPENCNDTGPPPPPPPLPEPEPVCDISIQGDLLYWVKPLGRVSEYEVKISDSKGVALPENKLTIEQFIYLQREIRGNLSIEVYSVLDGVRVPEHKCVDMKCCRTELYREGPVCDITLEDDFLYWASHGSVSYYEVEISGNTSVHTTTEQLFPLAKTLSGNFSIEICSIVDGVSDTCCMAELYREGPVCYITLQEDVLYWSSHGSVSSYGVKISDDKRVLLENATTEQVLLLPTDVVGKFSVEVCSNFNGVRGSCCVAELDREGGEIDSACAEDGGISTDLVVVAAACCGGTALVVGCGCLLVAAIHHWRFKKKFGPNKVAVTWDDYKIRD